MSRKKKEEFVLSNPPEDLGIREYAFGQTVNKQKLKGSAKIGERKKVWRSPASIYMIVLCVFLTFWFLYSLIAALVKGGGTVEILVEFLTSFMALVVCVGIIICTVFGLWGRLAQFALNHGMVKRSEVESVEESAEIAEEAYEKASAPDPFFEVYGDYIRATDGESIKVINRAGVQKVKAFERCGGCYIAIISDGEICTYDFVWLHGLQMPMREVKKLKELFGDKLEIEPLVSGEDRKRARRGRRSFSGFNIAPLVVGLICAAVGGGVIALHFCLAESIPIVLGAFFIAGGVLFACVAFEGVPVVKVFVVPLVFGGIMSFIPALFLGIIAEGNGIPLIFTSVHQFLCSFNALFCAVAFLEGIGVLILIIAFYNLYKYIRYGDQ